MRGRAAAAVVVAVLACAASARAQDAGDLDTSRRRPPGTPAVAGWCGGYSAWRGDVEDDQGLVLHDEWDPIQFRGIGSPGHGTDVSLAVQWPWRPDYAALVDVAIDARARAVLFNDIVISRNCLVLDVAGGTVAPTSLAGSAAVGLTFLSRQEHDRIRVEAGVDFAFPSAGGPVLSAEHVQPALAGALARLDDSYRLLPNLEWSVRGRLRFETRGDTGTHEWAPSIWLALGGYVGGARMATAVGSVEGLLGGVVLEVLGGSARVDRGRLGVRGGARVEASISSLWPTDVIFPLDVEGTLQLAYGDPHGGFGFEVELFGGGIAVTYLLAAEWWAQLGLRATLRGDPWLRTTATIDE